jgi:ABC-2 type transport system permease protein
MSDTRRSSYEETTLERLVAALAAPTNVVLGIGLALVLAGVVWVTGLLGERILLGFTEAARRSFATENYALVWLGANFATGVKALLWAVAFWQLRDLLAGYGLIPDPRGAAGAALRLAAMFVAAGLGAAVQVGTGLPLIWPLAAVSLLATEYLALRTKVPAIALREFKALLLNPLGYVVLAGFAVVAALMFAGAVNELAPVDAAGVRHPLPDQALLSIQPLTAFFSSRVLGFGFLILIPIITMRLVSEEKRSGTLEVLMTSPVAEWQVVAGKFLGAYGFYLVLWAVLLVHIWLIHGLGRPDLNVRDAATTDLSAVANGLSGWQVAGAYAGIALIGAGFLAIGLFCSCLAANQLAAAVLTLVALLAFTFQGFVENLPVTGDWAWFGLSARYLDLRQHLEWSARGTPDSRTVFLFLTLCGMFLFLSVCAFASRRWNDMNLGAFTGSGRALTAALGTLAVAAAAFAVLHDGLRADPAAVAEPLPPRLWKFAAATAGCIALGLLLPKVLGPARLLPAVVSVGWFAALQITDPVRLLPELPDGYNYAPAALKAAVAGLAALIAFLAVVPRLATLALTNRLIYGANVVVGGLAVLVIAVMANYLAVRYNAYLDWSPEQAFTLHPISVATLAGLAPDERPGVERAAEAARKAEAGFDELIKPDAAPEPSAAADVIASLDAALSALRGVAVAGPPVSESRLRTAKWDGAQPDTIREKLTLARNKLSETYPDANAAMTERRLARGHVADAAAALARLIPKRKLPDGSEADDIGIPEGETVRAIAFVGRYDPPKDRAEALDNVRRDTLERLFRRYADSLNRPGDVKFEYEFVDPRSEREAGRLKTLRNRHSVEGVRDVLLLFNNRQFVLNDEDLFKPTLTLRRFAELCSAWNREFERGQHRTKPPEPTEINRAAFERHKDIPLQFGEYGLREEDFELSAVEEIEQVVTNAVLRLVRGRLNILYFTQGHGEREAFPEGTDAAADAKKPALKKPDGEKDKGKDKDRKKDDRELTARSSGPAARCRSGISRCGPSTPTRPKAGRTSRPTARCW